jgi:primosomal protein N' (replication factor Y)
MSHSKPSTSAKPLIVRVAVLSPLRRTFDYLVTEEFAAAPPQCGCRVSIPFGKREVIGLVIEQTHKSDFALDKLKPVLAIIDAQPLLPESLFKLFIWAANYYHHPIGDALFNTLPVLLRVGRSLPPPRVTKLWKVTEVGIERGHEMLRGGRMHKQRALLDELLRRPLTLQGQILKFYTRGTLKRVEEKGIAELVAIGPQAVDLDNLLLEQPLKLNPSQQQAMDAIDCHGFNTWLIDGVTGSGKTEIYLQAIEKIIRYGRQALVMIPEISLTPQTEKRFRDRFNVQVAMLHSGLTDQERLESWTQAATGDAAIILGTRSAVFTPLKHPGIIIIDEEHDQSYKQQDGFRYSARDLAVIRAKQENIPIVLGSATPSLESLHNCDKKRYQHLILNTRAGDAKPPHWSMIDLKTEQVESGVAASTLNAIREAIANQQQVLVFLNRRGFAPAVLCHYCGFCAECPNCDARLTVHRRHQRLLCHHCNYKRGLLHWCPSCRGDRMVAAGDGTERSEAWLQECFPNTPVLRVDRDTTRKKNAMQTMYDKVDSGAPCILVGTQMLAKGHHFANITLVAVLDADSGLFSPDFRSHERLGQLLTQVAGRCGRGKMAGRVILQSHQPDHPLLEVLTQQPYSEYSKLLRKQRKKSELPPFKQLVLIRADAAHAQNAEAFLQSARQCAEAIFPSGEKINYLGPLPALMERRNSRHRYVLQISGGRRSDLNFLIGQLVLDLEKLPMARHVRWGVDVDPQEM